MLKTRCLAIGLATLGLAALSKADFNGPAPLVWRWSQNTVASPSGSPVVDGDIVYVSVGSRIYALDKDSGNQRWRYPIGEPINGVFLTSPLLINGLVVAADDNRWIYCVKASDGSNVWKYRMPQTIAGQIQQSGKLIVAQLSDNTIQVLDTETGQPVWENPQRIFTGIVGNIATSDGNVIVMQGDNKVVAKSIATQKTVWERSFTDLNIGSKPVVFNETIYLNNGPYVTALYSVNGKKKWEVFVGLKTVRSPAVSSEGIATITQDGSLFLIDPFGKLLTRKPIATGSSPSTSPSWVGKFVMVGSANGSINLIDPATKTTVWSYWIASQVRPRSNTASGGMMGGPLGGGPMGGGRLGGGRVGGNVLASSKPDTYQPVPPAGPGIVSGNTLLVLAQDGSLLAFDRDLGVDLTGPTVKMVWPSPGDDVSGQPPLELVFKIEDPVTGINENTINITIDGKPVNFKFGRDGFALVGFSEAPPKSVMEEFRYKANKPLSDGVKVIEVEVADYAGNVTKASYRLHIDNVLPPLSRDRSNQNNNRGFDDGPGGMGGAKGE